MLDGCNYELVILSAVWAWKAKEALNQPTNQPANQIYSLKTTSC